ncbi:MAG: DUF2197 domain-containing protein [Candidatus Saccharibacteria bacterium]
MVEARCMLCGKKEEVTAEHKEYKKLIEDPKKVTYICDRCNHKVRYETEEEQKPKKPI